MQQVHPHAPGPYCVCQPCELKSRVYKLKDSDQVGLLFSQSVGFSEWKVLIGLVERNSHTFDTRPDTEFNLSFFPRYRYSIVKRSFAHWLSTYVPLLVFNLITRGVLGTHRLTTYVDT